MLLLALLLLAPPDRVPAGPHREPAGLLPVGLAVSAAAISHWDKALEEKWHGVLGAKGYYSDIGQYTLLGSVFVLGVFFPGEGRNAWDEFWTIGESYAASSLTT